MMAGALRHRVILQRPGGSRDAVGERVTAWTAVATVWASVDPLSVREQLVASQAQSAVTHRVRLRSDASLAAIDHTWRVLFGSRVLVVDGVRNIGERGVELELLCVEGLRSE